MIKIFFILNRKVTPQKNPLRGMLAPRLFPCAQMTRLSRILGVWFTYYVPVLINFMTPSKHLSIVYQGINLRGLLRFFFLSKAPRVKRERLKPFDYIDTLKKACLLLDVEVTGSRARN